MVIKSKTFQSRHYRGQESMLQAVENFVNNIGKENFECMTSFGDFGFSASCPVIIVWYWEE